MAQVMKLNNHIEVPPTLRAGLEIIERNGDIDSVGKTLARGGLMYDGACFYPMRGNRVFYYNIFTKTGYVLQLKHPTSLTMEEVNAFRRLLHSECTEGLVKHFLYKYDHGYYKANSSEGFPFLLLPYIPYGCYEVSDTLVTKTMKVDAPVKGKRHPNNDAPYRFGQGLPKDPEKELEADQIAFGREFARAMDSGGGRIVNEVVSKAIKRLDRKH